MKVRILYDNRALEGYRADWGFACLIEGEEKVMLDTGASPAVLEHNMQQAGVKADAVDKVVLSHDHWDHTGGLPAIVSRNERVVVFVLPSFGATVRSHISQSVEVREVTAPGELSPGIHTTGPVGKRMPEQALWLRSDRGIVLITGCAHPGVDALMYAITPSDVVYGVVGGFHGFHNFEALEGIALLAPCHCTQYRKDIAERLPDSYREIMAGSELEF